MGRLRDFQGYIDTRRRTVEAIEARLLELQEKYETFFQEIQRVREAEIEQLTELFVGSPEALSPALRAKAEAALAKAENDFDTKLAELDGRWGSARAAAEQQRKASALTERAARAQNVDLDREEEALKARVEVLRERIEAYNQRIRQLGSGFGFFANFFKMRALRRERCFIEEAQEDLVARIEKVRTKWADFEEVQRAREAELKEKWRELSTEAAAIRAKIDYLRDNRERIVRRSMMEAVLFDLVDPPRLGAAGDPPCPRCERPNPPENFFCAYCAQRLGPDRGDLEGSLEEIAELNHHHRVFSEGMKACQEIIALIRGIGSGLDAFRKSVSSMMTSERRHGLPKLRIHVPEESVRYGRVLDRLLTAIEEEQEALHPLTFAEHVKALMKDELAAPRVEAYFERMGKELSRRAEAQW